MATTKTKKSALKNLTRAQIKELVSIEKQGQVIEIALKDAKKKKLTDVIKALNTIKKNLGVQQSKILKAIGV